MQKNSTGGGVKIELGVFTPVFFTVQTGKNRLKICYLYKVMNSELLTTKDILIMELNRLKQKRVRLQLSKKDISMFNLDDTPESALLKNCIQQEFKYQEKLNEGVFTQIVWITIIKFNKCKTLDFINKIHALTKYKLMQDKYKYCFECVNYDEEEQFQNVHCHFLAVQQKGVNKKKYITRLEDILKGYAFNINVKTYPSEYYNDKVQYLKGQKDQEDEHKQHCTNSLREQYKLLNLYE